MRGRKRRGEKERECHPWNGTRRSEERVAGVIRCEKSCRRQLCSQTLRVPFYKALHGFGFSKQFTKNTAETLGEITRGAIMNQIPDQSFKPSLSKLNDMHLIPVSPNKVVKERFHRLWFVSGKSMMTPPI